MVTAPVTSIPGSDNQRIQRVGMLHTRLYCETKVYLNNTNCKWIAVGVTPNQRAAGPVTNFETELYIGGDKCASVAIGGVVGFLQLVRQLRTIGYWQNMFLEVSSHKLSLFFLFEFECNRFLFTLGKIHIQRPCTQ